MFNAAQACASLWKEHGYKNGRVVFVSCESHEVGRWAEEVGVKEEVGEEGG